MKPRMCPSQFVRLDILERPKFASAQNNISVCIGCFQFSGGWHRISERSEPHVRWSDSNRAKSVERSYVRVKSHRLSPGWKIRRPNRLLISAYSDYSNICCHYSMKLKTSQLDQSGSLPDMLCYFARRPDCHAVDFRSSQCDPKTN